MRGKHERRSNEFGGFTLRSQSDERVLFGYVAVFNVWSQDLGGFRERVERGAFADSIKRDDIRALVNHDPNYVLGRSTRGTLRLWEDEHGLAFELDPPLDAQWARDFLVTIRRGDISDMSFGFNVQRDRWSQDEDGMVSRSLQEVALFDISPVAFPAYPRTSVKLRMGVPALQQMARPRIVVGGAVPRARLDILRRRLQLAECV